MIGASAHITNCSRGIHNAWHFHYALVLVIKVVCGGIGIALLTPQQGVSTGLFTGSGLASKVKSFSVYWFHFQTLHLNGRAFHVLSAGTIC